MAVTALSVAISCSRSAGSPGSLVTMPEVMIITEGFNPTCGIEIYGPRGEESRESARYGRREIVSIKKRSRRGENARGRAGCGVRRVEEASRRERRAEDDDIDCVLDPAFASTATTHPSGGGWDKMAAGRTSRLRSGLCVVINGNLKQRELTISFFISSSMLRAQERPRRTRPGRRANTHRRGRANTRTRSHT